MTLAGGGLGSPLLLAALLAAVRLEVPFFSDRADQCGPSALASVLRYCGGDADPAALKRELYRADLKGALGVDMLLAAQSRGMPVDLLDGGLPQIKKELDAGRPVIVLLNLGYRLYPVGHYLVVTGYDEARQGLFAHSGEEKDRFVAYKRFEKQWGLAEQWGLSISSCAR